MSTKLYNQAIKFPYPMYARIIGGHPAADIVMTEGVALDTLDDSQEPYYQCRIIGDPRAVYPYTNSPKRILMQSELAPLSKLNHPAALRDFLINNPNWELQDQPMAHGPQGN